MGLLSVAASYAGSRAETWWAPWAFWLGLLIIFTPIGVRVILIQESSRRERLGLLLMLGLLLYLVKYLQYPLAFANYDEFSHFRIALDILESGHLFHPSPVLPVGSFYPGLKIVTTTISHLTGLSIFAAGTIVIGVAKMLIILSLYLLYEHVSGSARAGGIATLIYMANPHFVLFSSEFSYESLAFPLAIWVLFVTARIVDQRENHRVAFTVIAELGLWAVITTHHLTSLPSWAFCCSGWRPRDCAADGFGIPSHWPVSRWLAWRWRRSGCSIRNCGCLAISPLY